MDVHACMCVHGVMSYMHTWCVQSVSVFNKNLTRLPSNTELYTQKLETVSRDKEAFGLSRVI